MRRLCLTTLVAFIIAVIGFFLASQGTVQTYAHSSGNDHHSTPTPTPVPQCKHVNVECSKNHGWDNCCSGLTCVPFNPYSSNGKCRPIATPTPTPQPTRTPHPTHTPRPTSTPCPTATPTPSPTNTPVPTTSPTATPTDTPIPSPTEQPTPTPTSTPVPTDTPIPTSNPGTPSPTTTPTESVGKWSAFDFNALSCPVTSITVNASLRRDGNPAENVNITFNYKGDAHVVKTGSDGRASTTFDYKGDDSVYMDAEDREFASRSVQINAPACPAGQVLGSTTTSGKVLGSTGVVEDVIMDMVGFLGTTLSVLGSIVYGKKKFSHSK